MEPNTEPNITEPIIISEKERQVFFNNFDLVIALSGLVFSLVFLVYPAVLENKKAELAAVAEANARPDPFASVSLQAKAAYVVDLKSGKVLFEKNSEVELPLASLTKLMTAITALSVVPEGTIITIDKEDLELEGDSGLYSAERWRLGDLLGLTLVESSNDGAFAVASSVGIIEAGVDDKAVGRAKFVELMNDKAKDLGLAQTYFNNSTGLDESATKAGGYGSARDIATLLGYAIDKYPDIFRNTKYSSLKVDSLNAPSHTARNTNTALDGIPFIVASKTGYTDLAGGNLAVVFDPGLNGMIAVAVLGSTENGRFDDVKNLSFAAIDSLGTQNPN